MRKLAILTLTLFVVAAVSAQNCERDSSLLISGELLSPKPWTPDTPIIYTAPACINEPYSQSVTFNIPETFTSMGITVPISSVTVATTGAISGLPAGLSYSCDPPNCIFNALTLGCILINGTPTPNNTPGDFELSIAVTANTPFGGAPLSFPGTLGNGEKYYITVKNTGECTSGTRDLTSQIGGMKNVPNPFGQQTSVIINAYAGGQYVFEVYNLVGQRIQEQTLTLVEGTNQFTFDAGDLANGTYYYSLGNGQGRVTNTFVINR